MVERADGAGSPRALTQTKMKKSIFQSRSGQRAFTLMELLVVISVIAVLAAMLFPAAAVIKRKAAVKRVQTQLKSIESAIDTYKENVKVMPPENAVSPGVTPHPAPEKNALFYELSGSKATATTYQPLSGVGEVTIGNLSTFLGVANAGLVNVARGGGEDESQAAKNCLSNIRPGQYLVTDSGVAVLGVPDLGPVMFTNSADGKIINPIRYTSTRATNNVGAYDLWVDVTISGKKYRIANWNDKEIPLP